MKNFSFFSFILIGNTHGFLNDFKKQKEIIEKVNPEYVLVEQLQDITIDDKKKYAQIFKNKKISKMVDYEEVEDLLLLCKNKDIKLVGIDLMNFGFDNRLQQVVKGKIKPTKEDEKMINELVLKREKKHLEVIKKYKKQTKKPIVIIVGSWYLRKGSLLRKNLENYLLIYPCDKNKKIILSPPKDNTQITYCEQIKNEKNQS